MQFKAFAVLCGSRRFLQEVADSDFHSDADMTVTSEVLRERAHRESRERSIQRCNLLRTRLWKSFLIIASAVLAAEVISVLWLRSKGVSTSFNGICTAGSVFVFAWATLGRLGWSGQSIGGKTIFERLDEKIFRILYWIGTFLGILALLA